MDSRDILLSNTNCQRAKKLADKLHNACAGESLPVVLVALGVVKDTVQTHSKVMALEETEEMKKRGSGN